MSQQRSDTWHEQLESEKQAEILKATAQIKSRNPVERSAAAQRLGELSGPAAELLAALNDRNQHVRAAAAGALAQADLTGLETEVVEQLLAAIDDSFDVVCVAAVRSLGLLRAHTAREQIAVCLRDSNPKIVRAAITALGRLGYETDSSLVEPYLDSEMPSLRGAAAQTLAALNYRPAIPRILAALETEIGRGLTEPHRRAILQSYVQALGEFRAAEAIEPLLKLTEGEVGLRSTALRALSRIGAELPVENLTALSKDPGQRLSAALASALERSDRVPETEQIRSLLSHPKATLRTAALRLIGRTNDVAVLETVRAMAYADPNPFVRPEAIAVLRTLLGSEVLPDLLALAEDSNPHVREAVAIQLGAVAVLNDNAVSTLNRLWVDERTRAAAEASLLAHQFPLPTVMEIPAPPPENSQDEAIPMAIRPEVQPLAPLLQRWQSALVGSVGRDVAQVRRSLEVLLSAILAATARSDCDGE